LPEATSLARPVEMGSTLNVDTTSGVVSIARVRIAVGELELEGEEEDDAGEWEMGETVVEVAPDGSPTEVVAGDVRAGSYEELGLELMVSDGSEDSRFADLAGASILVEGRFKDAAFTYRSQYAPELEFDLGTPAIVPEGGSARIAVTFDAAAWFVTAEGAALDPNDPAVHPAIEDNIMRSMAAFAEAQDD
jgi:hypothetical protein